jgi:aldose 1-epimerase
MMNKLFFSAVATLTVVLSGSASTGSSPAATNMVLMGTAPTGSSTYSSCCADTSATAPCKITQAPFGKTGDGQSVDIFTLRNLNGVEARICNYGGIIVSLKAPDRDGHLGDVVLGFDDLRGYLTNNFYFGSLIGRYCNRIARGKFTLDGVNYRLMTNDYPDALHGGYTGFDKVVWSAKVIGSDAGPALELIYCSKDGEEGYPGSLVVRAVYTLTSDNGLRLEYTATTDKDTVVNLTVHPYFNLAGHGDILGHKVFIDADKFTPVDETLIPTGELRPVDGTPLDFLQPTAIGARIQQDDRQLKFGKGYNHNFIINHPMGRLDVIAQVSEPTTGRVLEVLSTEPGLHFYSGNFLDGTSTGKGGQVYNSRSGFCMEPQHFPDSPNEPEFPSTVLRPGQIYHNTIIYRLSTSR